MTTTIDLRADNHALIRAAWTAMDQSWSRIDRGYILQAIDNSGQGRTQPWQTPTGFKLVDSIDDPDMGGKIVIYKNAETNQVMVTPGGTGGISDAVGWYMNFKDFGRSQLHFAATAADGNCFQSKVFIAMNKALQNGAQLVVTGSSKGGAQSQFMVYDIVKNRDNGTFEAHGFTNLANLRNTRIAIVARSMPGTEDILRAEDPSYRPNDPKYSGIQSHYSAARMEEGSKTELVSQVGGGLIANDGNICYFGKGAGADPSPQSMSGNQHACLHRLAYSCYDAMAALDGDFGRMTLQPRVTIDLRELAAIGSVFAQGGQREAVQSTEALARIGAGLICASVWSPLASLADILQGQFRLQTVLGIPSMLFWASGLGPSMLAACGIAVAGANGVRYTGDGRGRVEVANEHVDAAINLVNAPPNAPAGSTRYFGHARTGGTYVFDAAADQSGGTLYCMEEGVRTAAFVQSQSINFSRFDALTGSAIADGIFICEPGQQSVLDEMVYGPAGQIVQQISTTADTGGRQIARLTVYLDDAQNVIGSVEEETLPSGAQKYSVYHGTGELEYSQVIEQMGDTVRITKSDACSSPMRAQLRKSWQDEDEPICPEEAIKHVGGEKNSAATDTGGDSKALMPDAASPASGFGEAQRQAVLDELYAGTAGFLNALHTRDKVGLLLSGARIALDYTRLNGTAAPAGFDTLLGDAGSAAGLLAGGFTLAGSGALIAINPVVMIVAAFILDQLMADDPPPPPPVGEAVFRRNADGSLGYQLINAAHGGAEILSGQMDALLARLEQQLVQANSGNTNPDLALTLIASRMPKVIIQSWPTRDGNGVSNYFFMLEQTDPHRAASYYSGVARQHLVRLYGQTLVLPEAIAPRWQVEHVQASFDFDEPDSKTEGKCPDVQSPTERQRRILQEAVAEASAVLGHGGKTGLTPVESCTDEQIKAARAASSQQWLTVIGMHWAGATGSAGPACAEDPADPAGSLANKACGCVQPRSDGKGGSARQARH